MLSCSYPVCRQAVRHRHSCQVRLFFFRQHYSGLLSLSHPEFCLVVIRLHLERSLQVFHGYAKITEFKITDSEIAMGHMHFVARLPLQRTQEKGASLRVGLSSLANAPQQKGNIIGAG